MIITDKSNTNRMITVHYFFAYSLLHKHSKVQRLNRAVNFRLIEQVPKEKGGEVALINPFPNGGMGQVPRLSDP